jgi:hypothetical protein
MKLETVEVGDSLKKVGDMAFYCGERTESNPNPNPNMLALTIDLSKVEYIGHYAFTASGIASPENAPLDLSSAAFIGELAFAYTANLHAVTLSEELTALSDGAFAWSGLSGELDLKNVKAVGGGAFFDTADITAVTAEKVVVIGLEAFARSGITELILGGWNTLRVIEGYAFYDAENLTRISGAYTGLTYVGDMAFAYCGITEFMPPPALQFVGYGAFADTPALSGFSKNVPLYAGSAMTKPIYTYTVNGKFFVEDGVLYEVLPNGGYMLLAYPGGRADIAYTVLDNTVRIGDNAFSGNVRLSAVTLPYELVSIGDRAFYGCSALRMVNFGSLKAPVLESMVDADTFIHHMQFPDSRPGDLFDWRIYDITPYYYANFVGALGEVTLSATYPANGTGYGDFIYSKYFRLSARGEIADETTRRLIADIAALPDTILLTDAGMVEELRARYDALSQIQRQFVSNYERLTAAESVLAALTGGNTEPPVQTGNGQTGAVIALSVTTGVATAGGGAMLLYYFLVLKKRGKGGLI